MMRDVRNMPHPTVVASLRGVEINGVRPKIGKCNFIAPNAAVFGDVSADLNVTCAPEDKASIWYGTILKGEKNAIRIGSQSVVLDNVRIRTDFSAVVIGRNAYIGSSRTVYKRRCHAQLVHYRRWSCRGSRSQDWQRSRHREGRHGCCWSHHRRWCQSALQPSLGWKSCQISERYNCHRERQHQREARRAFEAC